MLQADLSQLLEGVVASAVELGPARDDLVEQLALAVLLARLGVRLRNRKRLAEGSPTLSREHDHAGGRRSLHNGFPFLGTEVGLARHRAPPLVVPAACREARYLLPA